MATITFRPSVADLGAIMRGRTHDPDGDELGTFTEDTRPTADEADGVLDQATALVASRLGAVPARFEDMARAIVTLRAAMLVETGYFQEEADPGQSAYAAYREQYRDALADYDVASKADVGPGRRRVGSLRVGTLLSQASE